MSRMHDQLSKSYVAPPPRTDPPPKLDPAAPPPPAEPKPIAIQETLPLTFDPPQRPPPPPPRKPAARQEVVKRPQPEEPEPRQPAAVTPKPLERQLIKPEPARSAPLGGKKVVAVFLVVCAVLMAAMIHHILSTHTEFIEVAPSPEAANPPPVVHRAAPAPVAAERRAPPPEKAAAPEPTPASSVAPAKPAPQAPKHLELNLNVAGAHVTADETGPTVVFDHGIFARVDQLRPEAVDAIAALAASLKQQPGQLSVLVTGFTDNDPVPPNRPYKTNVELGMMRAMAVSRALIEAGMTPASITTRSLGDQQTPYPNDSPENRARNRTVTIAVRPAGS